MKLRWHLVSLFLAIAVAGVMWLSTNGPLWQLDGYEFVRFAGYCEATQELRSLVAKDHGKSWYLETRDVHDGRFIREVMLEMPVGVEGFFHIANGNSVQPGLTPVVLVQSIRRNTSSIDQCYLFDPKTGARLRKVPFALKSDITPMVRGDRIAIVTTRDLWLIDERNVQGRSFNIVGIECLQISYDGKWVAYFGQDGVHIIEWETGKNHLVLESDKTNYFSLMSFQRDGRLLLASYDSGFRMSRWRWDGKRLQQVTPEFVAYDQIGGGPFGTLLIKEEGSRCHVASYAYVGWPSEIRTVCRWLEAQGLNVKKWLPYETRFAWHVLDDDNHELSRYEQAAFGPIILSDRLSVKYMGSIELWVTSPRWPNLLALGMMVYLLIYVIVRCRAFVTSGP